MIKLMPSFEKSRYPNDVSRIEYTRTIAQLRHDNMGRAFRELLPNYTIVVRKANANGTDILVFDKLGSKPIGRFELKNENTGSYFRANESVKIINDVGRAKYNGVICSHGNFPDSEDNSLFDIPICRLGFQTLPKEYYWHFTKHKSLHKRRLDSARTHRDIKRQLEMFLFKIGLLCKSCLVTHVCTLKSKVCSIRNKLFGNRLVIGFSRFFRLKLCIPSKYWVKIRGKSLDSRRVPNLINKVRVKQNDRIKSK